MRHDKYSLRLLTAMIVAFLGTHNAVAADKNQRIQKCQDAKGVWHYGDTADEECAKSKITVINQQGVRVKEVAAPPTEAELAEQARNRTTIEAEQRRIREQEMKDKQLLAIYGHEDDIALVRDRKLADIHTQTKGTQATLETLTKSLERMQAQAEAEKRAGRPIEQNQKDIAKTQAQIEKHSSALQKREAEKAAVLKQYEVDLARYRELKSGRHRSVSEAKR